MTPARLAKIYALAFPTSRPWQATEFTSLLDQPSTFLTTHNEVGFALGRVVVDEAELITFAVVPNMQNQGIGRQMLAAYETTAKTLGATRGFLEVAEDNSAAISLYTSGRWRESARRRGYYTRVDGPCCDALIFEKPLT